MTIPTIPAFLLAPYVPDPGFYVIGGEFKANDWQELATPPAIYGPYADEETAVNKWREITGLTVDNCLVRYFVVHKA